MVLEELGERIGSQMQGLLRYYPLNSMYYRATCFFIQSPQKFVVHVHNFHNVLSMESQCAFRLCFPVLQVATMKSQALNMQYDLESYNELSRET